MHTLRVLDGRRAVTLREKLGKDESHGRRLNTKHVPHRAGRLLYLYVPRPGLTKALKKQPGMAES